MASSGEKSESLVWTDDEVKLLLGVTLDYKSAKHQENVDWESCHSKYADITLAFRQQYPSGDMAVGKDFPHDPKNISHTQLSTKLKGVRNKYRHAVDSGRRSGHGRVVLIFFELCEEIWGGSPATTTIPSGIETADVMEDSSSPSRPTSPDADLDSAQSCLDSAQSCLDSAQSFLDSAQSSDSLPAGVVRRRRNLLQAKLDGYRGERLKRRAPAEAAAQEDLQIKRSMLELMREDQRIYTENMRMVNSNIASITHTIKDGFDLLRTLIQQQTPVPAHQCLTDKMGDSLEQL